MPKNKIILSIGVLVALLPVLGFPHAWESFFQVLFGLGIVLLSVLISVDRRLSMKARVEKRQARKRALHAEVPQPQGEVVFGRRATDVVAGTKLKVGRRATDVMPIAKTDEQ